MRVLCNPWENISVRNICAHLCHLWEDISARGFCGFCEFCGRMQWLLCWCSGDHCTPWEGALVWQGCHTLLQLHILGAKILRVLCNPWEDISVRNICVPLCNLWEDISARGFCGFCEFCGRICAVCLVGAVETTAPPCRVQKVH